MLSRFKSILTEIVRRNLSCQILMRYGVKYGKKAWWADQTLTGNGSKANSPGQHHFMLSNCVSRSGSNSSYSAIKTLSAKQHLCWAMWNSRSGHRISRVTECALTPGVRRNAGRSGQQRQTSVFKWTAAFICQKESVVANWVRHLPSGNWSTTSFRNSAAAWSKSDALTDSRSMLSVFSWLRAHCCIVTHLNICSVLCDCHSDLHSVLVFGCHEQDAKLFTICF